MTPPSRDSSEGGVWCSELKKENDSSDSRFKRGRVCRGVGRKTLRLVFRAREGLCGGDGGGHMVRT